MTEQGTAEPKRRGVGFPQMPLRESVDAIVTIGLHGANHSHDAAAAYLGHSTANSGAFRTKLAALRDWGLLVRGDKDRVMLSELAQQVVLEAPDHQQARGLLLAAFESCRVFGVLYNDSAKDTPLDVQRIRTTVVMRHGVASDQADKFVDSFIESSVYAGLAKFDGTKLTLVLRDTSFKTDDVPDNETGSHTSDAALGADIEREQSLLGRIRERSPATPVALRQTWPIDGGEIEFVIRTPKALPPAIYRLMAKMAEVAAEMEMLLRPEVVDFGMPASTTAHSESEPTFTEGN